MIKGKKREYHSSFTKLGLSRIVEISERARIEAPEFEKRTGKPFIYFQRGEIDLPLPYEIKNNLERAISEGKTKYPKSGGEPFFKEAVINYFEESGIRLRKENVMATYGGQEGLMLAFALYRGSKAAGFGPCWSCILQNIVPYTETDFSLVPLEKKDGNFIFDENKLEEKLRNVELFYLNNPHNPTGKVFSRDELERINYLCKKHDVILISDEPYNEIVFDGKKHVSVLELENVDSDTIVSSTFSKSFSATGLRIGYAISRNLETINLMTKGEYTQTAAVHTPTQYALASFLNNKNKREELLKSRREEFEARRDTMYKTLHSILCDAPKPEGAFYFFPDLKKFFPKADDIDETLLNLFMKNGIAIVPGGEFGKEYEGHIRLSFSGMNNPLIKEGSERLKSVLEKAEQLTFVLE